MSRTPSTDLEQSSEIPAWILLVCSGLALVMFFGWIVKDLSVIVSPNQGKSLVVQPLPEAGSIPDTLYNSVSAIEPADGQAISGSPSGGKSDKESAEPKGSSVPGSAKKSSAQSIQRVAGQTSAETLKIGQSSIGQARQFARQKDSERTSYQQRAAEPPATDRNNPGAVVKEHESAAYASRPQSETTQAFTDRSAEAPFDSVPTEPAQTVAMQESVVSAAEFSGVELLPEKELPGIFGGVVSPPNSSVQTNMAEQAKGISLNTTLRQTQRLSADLGALRLLLAEAASINETEDEQAQEERVRGDELESLGVLSTTIQFAPGSKVASESVTSTLNQIQRILTDYPETMIKVIVATNESGDEKQDLLLSQERGRTLIARLVNKGLAFSRFSLEALTDDQLPADTHRVEIQAHSES